MLGGVGLVSVSCQLTDIYVLFVLQRILTIIVHG